MSRPGSKRALRRHHTRRLRWKRAKRMLRSGLWYSTALPLPGEPSHGYSAPAWTFYKGSVRPNPEYWNEAEGQKGWSRWATMRQGGQTLGLLKYCDFNNVCSCESCRGINFNEIRNTKRAKFRYTFPDDDYPTKLHRRVW